MLSFCWAAAARRAARQGHAGRPRRRPVVVRHVAAVHQPVDRGRGRARAQAGPGPQARRAARDGTARCRSRRRLGRRRPQSLRASGPGRRRRACRPGPTGPDRDVTDPTSLAQLVRQTSPVVLVLEDPRLAAELPAAHVHQLVVVAPPGGRSDVDVPPVDAQQFEALFRTAGETWERAAQLGRLARRSLPAVRRRCRSTPPPTRRRGRTPRTCYAGGCSRPARRTATPTPTARRSAAAPAARTTKSRRQRSPWPGSRTTRCSAASARAGTSCPRRTPGCS